jgi:HEAT repeat protein
MTQKILQYCAELAEELERTWQRLPIAEELRGSEPIPLQVTYTLHEGSHEPREQRIFFSAQEAIEVGIQGDEPAVVYGGPGAGKSVTMKWMARQQAKSIEKEGASLNHTVPIYIDLGGYREQKSLSALRATQLEKFPALKEAKRITWLLDGLDLLPEGGEFTARDVLRQARDLCRDSNDRVVLSTRPSWLVDGELNDWGQSTRINLAPLTPQQRSEWVQQYCPQAMPGLQKFEQAHGDKAGFLNTPLLFSMVLSALLDEGLQGQPFRCDEYPGRAGLFHGFVGYALDRAVRERRITQQQRQEYDSQIVEGVFWAALTLGQEDRLLNTELNEYLAKAFSNQAEQGREQWLAAIKILTEAGLVYPISGQDAIGVLHQQFAEHWAGQHLARRLEQATKGGWYEAELWDHFKEVRLDPVTAQALDILSKRAVGEQFLVRAYELLRQTATWQAINFLAHMGNNWAFQHLVELANAPYESVCRCAAIALGSTGRAEAVGPLVKMLKDSREWARGAAIKAIAKLPTGDSVTALVGACSDRTLHVRWMAIRTLVALGRSEVVGLLIKELKDPTDRIRLRAIWALKSLRRPEATQALIEALKDPNEQVCLRVASALNALRHPKGFTYLVKALKSSSKGIRTEAAEALGAEGRQLAVGSFIQALKDQRSYVRMKAAVALGVLGQKEAVSPLVEALKDPKKHVRLKIVGALGTLRQAEAVEHLIEAINDPEDQVRSTAAGALGVLGQSQAVGPLVESLKDPISNVRLKAAEALGKLASSQALDPLIKLLKDSDWQVRLKVAEALGSLGLVEAFGPLSEALKDPNEGVRQRSAKALGQLGCPEALGPLIDAMQDPDPGVRKQVTGALGALGLVEGIDTLVKALLKDSPRLVKSWTSEALAQIGHARPRIFLVKLSKKIREENISYDQICSIAIRLNMRIEPWDMEKDLAQQRHKREESQRVNSENP